MFCLQIAIDGMARVLCMTEFLDKEPARPPASRSRSLLFKNKTQGHGFRLVTNLQGQGQGHVVI